MGGKTLKRGREPSAGDTPSLMPSKKRRQVNANDVKLSKLYEELAAEADEIRLEAAKQIIMKFSPENQPSPEAILQALGRLIRGLCSQRKAARFGFCITLTELLRQLLGRPIGKVEGLQLDVKRVMEMVEEQTKVEGNIPGQTRRDHLIGKLFGYKAVMQSSILTEPELSLECWNMALDHIYGMARDVPWLREECGLILVEAVKSLNEQSSARICLQELTQRLVSFKLTNTPEGVAVWLAVRGQSPDVLPHHVWHHSDPLSKKERSRLAKILKEDFSSAAETSKEDHIKSSAANPNPIFAWDVVLSEMLQRDQKSKTGHGGSAKAEKVEFPQFWVDLVDNGLFSSSSSHERRSWGFKILARLVGTAPGWALAALFSPNLMRSLINQSRKEDRFLHAASLAALKAIHARVEQDPASAAPLFIALSSKNGIMELDKITKTKTLEQIILLADDETLRAIIRHLHSLVLRPESDDQAGADFRRQTIADMLLTTVKNYKRYESSSFTFDTEHDNWLRNVLDTLVEFAFFVPNSAAKTSKVPLPPLSDPSRKIFQERLASCLTRLLRVETTSRVFFAIMVIGMIRGKKASATTLDLVFKADKAIQKTLDEAFKSVEALIVKGPGSGRESTAQGLILLYSLALLQVFDGDGDAVLLLADLNSARKSLLKSDKKSSSAMQDGFVEIILAFLGNPRTLFRTIAKEVFEVFARDITSEGLQSLTDILDIPENTDGLRELFQQAEEDAEDASSDDDLENASDVEMVDGSATTSNKSDLDDSDEVSDSDDENGATTSTSDDDEEDDDVDDEEVARFDDLLALTLQTSKPSLNGAASDETSDESDMDDEQMMALDPHLTKIFQERGKTSGKKKQREDAKQTVVQFKSRVLDLLTIYLEKEYSNPLALEALLPILRRTRAGTNKQLAEKSNKLVQTYTNTRKHHNSPLPKPVDIKQTWEILEAIHQEAKEGGQSNDHAAACSIASLHLVKILVGLDKNHYARIIDLYAAMQKEWFMNEKLAGLNVFSTALNTWSTSVRNQGKIGK